MANNSDLVLPDKQKSQKYYMLTLLVGIIGGIAIKLLQKAIELNDCNAMNYLALIYIRGQ